MSTFQRAAPPSTTNTSAPSRSALAVAPAGPKTGGHLTGRIDFNQRRCAEVTDAELADAGLL